MYTFFGIKNPGHNRPGFHTARRYRIVHKQKFVMLRIPRFTLLAVSRQEQACMKARDLTLPPSGSAYALIFQRIQISHVIDYHEGNFKGQGIVENADIQSRTFL